MVDPEDQYSVKEYYEASVFERLDFIRYLHTENKVFQRIRETFHGNWKIVELCREALFNNAKLSNRLKQGIEDDRKSIEELS